VASTQIKDILTDKEATSIVSFIAYDKAQLPGTDNFVNKDDKHNTKT
jgi:hypothetical protein